MVEIKVGQYGRSNNIFGEVMLVDETLYIVKDKHIISIAMRNNTANTPQELLRKNDLVVIDNYWEEPLFVDHIDFFNDARAIVRTSSGSETINLSNKTITKIYTPNSNGDLIKQWEAK